MESEKTMRSSENVRPSSPTPQHLQKYKLSMLDQLAPSMVIPIVLYFLPKQQSPDHVHLLNNIITEKLKLSLSTTLSRFYPLSGRVSGDGQSIDCNDQGVPFTVVEFAGQNLSDLLRNNPDHNLPRHLLPCPVTWDASQPPHGCVALIQLSHFRCGGFALGAVFWHKVGDAVTVATFLDSWAATTRPAVLSPTLAAEPVVPDYTAAAAAFPHNEQLAATQSSSYSSLSAIMRTGKSVMHRYVFDRNSISSIRAAAAAGRRPPSRVEVVSALIWRCFMSASLANGRSESVLTHAVNMRRRAHPPLAAACFGNFAGVGLAASENTIGDLGRLVGKMREGISKIDGDFVERMTVQSGGLAGYEENVRQTWSGKGEGVDPLCVSSWCNMGLYDVDFGWGKPTWVNRFDTGNHNLDSPFFFNLVWLMDSRDGDGVEAWVTLDEKYMDVFDRVQDLRDHASVDPTPLTSPTHA
ncbi:hypothetical protein ACP275_04G150200 [Erythranthe tilingii]